jgi:hypothetical protein
LQRSRVLGRHTATPPHRHNLGRANSCAQVAEPDHLQDGCRQIPDTIWVSSSTDHLRQQGDGQKVPRKWKRAARSRAVLLLLPQQTPSERRPLLGPASHPTAPGSDRGVCQTVTVSRIGATVVSSAWVPMPLRTGCCSSGVQRGGGHGSSTALRCVTAGRSSPSHAVVSRIAGSSYR